MISNYFFFPTTILILIIIRKYREFKWGKCKNNVKLDGKYAIVTGANSGIGFEITRELALRNASVILACRDLNKAKKAIECIKNELKSDVTLIPMLLDLSDLNSVKEFSNEIIKKYDSIDFLFNNAGVSFPNNQKVYTKNGFEIHFGVNYLAHFYLTKLLLNLLRKSNSKVINISSSLHERGEIDFDNLGKYSTSKKGKKLYSNSKLMNIYFGRELSKRYKELHVYNVCPGWVYTGLFRNSIKWWHYVVIAPIAFFFMRSPRQGCQTAIFCATEPELDDHSGFLYRDCKRYESRKIFYEGIQVKLWEESEKIVNNFK